MVLVDSSIWIGYFSKGWYQDLDKLIKEDLVYTNDIILAELIPFMYHAHAITAIQALKRLEKFELEIHWPGIIELQKLNLKNGINNVGIPDLIILQYAIQHHLRLWSNDKHFRLMQDYIDIRMYVP